MDLVNELRYRGVPAAQVQALLGYRESHPTCAVPGDPDGWRLHDGGGPGPAIVLLPGLLGSCELYAGLVDELDVAARVVCVEYPPLTDPSRFEAGVRRVVDVLGLERPHLLGVSVGGWLALRLLIGASDRFASAVLVESGLPDTQRAREWHHRYSPGGVVTPRVLRRLGPRLALHRLDPPRERRAFWSAYLTETLGEPGRAAVLAATLAYADLVAREGLTAPPDDARVLLLDSAASAAGLPPPWQDAEGVEVRRLPGRGEGAHVLEPWRYAEAVLSFTAS